MGLTDADYGAIQDMVSKMLGKAMPQPFIQGIVAEVDENKRLIFVKELADIPIPIVEFEHEVKVYMKTDPGTPVGSISMWPSATAPTNHLLAEGGTANKNTWPELFSEYGYTFGGSGDNFGLPNWKGRAPVGHDSGQAEFDSLGEEGGAKTHTLSTAELASHAHQMPQHTHGGPVTWYLVPEDTGANFFAAAGGANIHGATGTGGVVGHPLNTTNQGSGNAHNNLQPYKTVKFIIRAASSTGSDEPQVEIQKRITTPVLPKKGEMVLVALVMGDRRMPRCLGVISSPASYLVHPGD